ncbi:MAG: tRNA pseudouridine(38-40) synthase TruA, partial [Candidatus Omnitrophica bacterium]|nr:tRNA pseudouridine(38-40) synthase TruA [Candidatus Omnitrophota bacterium]
ESFNSQHSARSKLYRYTIFNNDFLDPIVRHYAAKCFYSLDTILMKKAARILEGRHDFKAFQAKDNRKRDSVRTLKRVRIKKDADMIYMDMEADGFLYNMARNIAGTLVEVGRGKISVNELKIILKKKDRRISGPTMPAKGLCLMKVSY